MAESSLQDRLRDHAKAFDGLLSLIPAKMYYGDGEDNSDQWRKKKQSKAQAAEARRNKLDPDSELNRSVKEVMDEQARKKRKRDEGQDDEDNWSDVEGIDAETPFQGLKKKKKAAEAEPEMTEQEQRKEEKKAAKKERKAERKVLREEEAEYEKRNVKSGVNKTKLGPRVPMEELEASGTEPVAHVESDDVSEADEDAEATEAPVAEDHDAPGAAADEEGDNSEAASTPPSEPDSPVFDPNGTPADSTGQAPSSTTSLSSTTLASEKPSKKTSAENAAIRARFEAKLKEMRAARKADGPDGKPIRTRQELIESRRQKQTERKAHKQELRQKAKEEEAKKREEALASARNSPMIMLSPSVDTADTNFAFGRVAFGDGTQLSRDLSHVLNNGKKKGPSDPKTALQRLQHEKKRLAEMDEEKRKDIEDKETWLTAKKRVQGEKVRDDEKLLKKALKRKETQKKKSEKAWGERTEGVQKSMKQRQDKREGNIRARKEQKQAGKAGKKKGGPKKSGAKKGPAKKGRAGFEGSFSVGGKKK